MAAIETAEIADNPNVANRGAANRLVTERINPRNPRVRRKAARG